VGIPGPPAGYEGFTYLIVGAGWPKPDETGMAYLGQIHDWLVVQEARLDKTISRAIFAISRAGEGPAIEACVTYLRRIGGSAAASMAEFRENIKKISLGAKDIATQVEYAKLMIIMMAVYLANTIARTRHRWRLDRFDRVLRPAVPEAGRDFVGPAGPQRVHGCDAHVQL